MKNPINLIPLRPLIGSVCNNIKRAPFNSNGAGKEFYLSELPTGLYDLFSSEVLNKNPDQAQELGYIKDMLGVGSNFSGIATMCSLDLKLGLNTILFGPPGTGKTFITKRCAVAICKFGGDVSQTNSFTESQIEAEYNSLFENNRIAMTTFHQSYAYEDFIEGLRPDVQSGRLKYKIIDGVFKDFCVSNKGKTENCVFIIDEINRGNISKIFGELITLIEDSKRENSKLILPYSKKPFEVPKNIYLLGTMNTADRSIALLDTALRRRFDFVEMRTNTDIFIQKNIDKIGNVDLVSLVKAMNQRIEVLLDREHTIGHALFLSLEYTKSLDELARIFKYKVIPLLQEYFYDDYKKIALVLGDDANVPNDNKFIISRNIDVSKLFEGNSGDEEIDNSASEIYEINFDALTKEESYTKIYKKWLENQK